jgi:hypothetical protein
MQTKTDMVSKDRLTALRIRQARLNATIAAEIVLEQKRKARERKRHIEIIGEALLEEAERSPNLKTMLKQTLNTAVVDEKSRRLLSTLGWL